MGSPVSVIIADLVMEHGEVQALPTFMASNRWWFRYVDDSNAKSTELHNSHHHLNAVNSHIQFTVEHRIPGYERLRCKYTENPPIPTSTRHLIDTTLHNIRDPSPARSCATRLPSLLARPSEQKKHPTSSTAYRFNGYPTRCIQNAAQLRSGPQSHHPDPPGLAVIPYVQGVSDRVQRILQHFNIKTAFKPIRTLASVFKKPKDRPSDEKIAGIVYRVECKDCDFSYLGESKWCWASRRVEQDPARAASKESALRQHAERTTHDIHPRYSEILERNETNYKHRIFL